ncbi:MAG: M48 family metallopeptidase [Alistipes sp.]|nr:M48 family metallopeptidase [Alistipes sp.]
MFGRGKSAEKSLYNHPLLGEVALVRSWRSRRLSLVVRPSGEVRLTYPRFVPKAKALEFLDSRVGWVEQSRQRFAERGVARVEYTPEQIEQMRREAKEVLPGRVAFWTEKFGFRYGRVTIRASRSKWGSCSGENNISLSLFLMTLPPHLRDYVIIHELCHTVHHNHSAAFHALADRCMGGKEKNLRSELRRFSI